MVDISLAVPEEVCGTLGERARARRLMLNLSVEELAARVGISNKTLSNFERTGKCTLETFVRVLEALDALPDLQNVLVTQSLSIEDMRLKAAVRTRQRAYSKARRERRPSERTHGHLPRLGWPICSWHIG
jgi:transcriptional regulator with XRE-family HTH domain